VVFVDPYQGNNNDVMPSLTPSTNKAYVEFVGVKTAHTYLQAYIVKSNNESKES
jgi:hypothetical protein